MSNNSTNVAAETNDYLFV